MVLLFAVVANFKFFCNQTKLPHIYLSVVFWAMNVFHGKVFFPFFWRKRFKMWTHKKIPGFPHSKFASQVSCRYNNFYFENKNIRWLCCSFLHFSNSFLFWLIIINAIYKKYVNFLLIGKFSDKMLKIEAWFSKYKRYCRLELVFSVLLKQFSYPYIFKMNFIPLWIFLIAGINCNL